jgi:carbon storage regulator CsrA
MLVLSRRPGQKVVFPGLGIAIEVLRSGGSVTRLGIEAPDNVLVLREEILEKSNCENRSDVASQSPLDRERQHEWRNKLNQMVLKLELLKGQLESGQAGDSERRLNDVFNELTDLEQATTDAIVNSSSPRVLIVEDQANERELLASCLRLRGIEVGTAGNGREAFDFLHEHELPDLVLLDMRMPDVDGPTFLKSIRDDVRLRDLRVFAVSGSSPDEFHRDPLPLDGWISKPVRIDALMQAVRTETFPAATSA